MKRIPKKVYGYEDKSNKELPSPITWTIHKPQVLPGSEVLVGIDYVIHHPGGNGEKKYTSCYFRWDEILPAVGRATRKINYSRIGGDIHHCSIRIQELEKEIKNLLLQRVETEGHAELQEYFLGDPKLKKLFRALVWYKTLLVIIKDPERFQTDKNIRQLLEAAKYA